MPNGTKISLSKHLKGFSAGPWLSGIGSKTSKADSLTDPVQEFGELE